MIKKTTITLIAFTAFVCVGCDQLLDPETNLFLTEEQVTSTYNNTQARAAAIYTYLPNGLSYIDGAMMASASDEAEHTIETSTIHKFNVGSWSAVDNPDNAWTSSFEGIYAANLFLENVDSVKMDYYKLDPNQSQQEAYKNRLINIERWKYEVRFLRAFFYFELVKRYGGVPLLKNTLSLKDNFASIPRSSLSDCIQFISDECDSAASVLPVRYEDADLGRVSKGAALGLKSRVMLYAASDLFNDPSWAAGYNHPELISLTDGKTRQERWELAAGAAAAVINLSGSGYQIDKGTNAYQNLFKSFSSPEIIFTRRNGASNTFEKANYPVGYDLGNSGTTPTQNLVDDYEMSDGTMFDWNNPVHKADPYANRDLRLKQTILTNNQSFKDRTIEAWKGGKDGKGIARASKTGYYLNKYIDSNLDLLLGQASIHSWIYIRYAEIYLNYAEAVNEAYGPNSRYPGTVLTARQALNQIRQRSELPNIASTSDPSVLREKIRHERRIEFAFEDHRFWDVRRWMIASDVLNSIIKGVDIEKNDDVFEYTVVSVENRVFEEKMYFYPIPQKDINIMKEWPQNPLW